MITGINQSPGTGYSAHFPLYHAVNTDYYYDPTLRIVFEIVINNVTVYTAKVYPPPQILLNAYFDASQIIQNWFAGYYTPTNALFSWSTDSIAVTYTVRYGEEWINSSGAVVQSLNQLSSTHTVYNCYPEYLQDGQMTVMPNGFQLLSDRDTANWYIANNASMFIPFQKGASTNPHQAWLEAYNGGASQGFITTGSILNSNIKRLIQFRVSKALLSAWNDSTTRVNLLVYDTAPNAGTLKNLNLIPYCNPRHTPITATFLNRYGAYESFVFGLVNKKEVEFDRKLYSPSEFPYKSIPAIVPPPDPSVFIGSATNFDSTTKVYNPMFKQRSIKHSLIYNLVSDWVTEKNHNWLKQLVASPEVYIEQNGYFYPVIVKNNSWKEKKDASDKLYNMEITVESFSNVYSQAQ